MSPTQFKRWHRPFGGRRRFQTDTQRAPVRTLGDAIVEGQQHVQSLNDQAARDSARIAAARQGERVEINDHPVDAIPTKVGQHGQVVIDLDELPKIARAS